jgi:hypothetical protein
MACLVALQMLIEGQAFPPEGMSGKPKMAYYQTPEDNLGNLAQYYGVPTVSYRNMMWPICESGSVRMLLALKGRLCVRGQKGLGGFSPFPGQSMMLSADLLEDGMWLVFCAWARSLA